MLNSRKSKVHQIWYTLNTIPLQKADYLGSVILMISLANLPMKFTLSSTGEKRGIGIAVDWYTLCQSKIYQTTHPHKIKEPGQLHV